MAISFVNSTGLTIGTAASTWSIPVQTGLTGGGALVVGIGCNTGVTVTAVTDNTANVYSSVVRANAPSTSSADLYFANVISSASTRISISLSGNSSGSIAVGHWTGISTANAVSTIGSSAISANSTSHGASEVTSSGCVFISFSRMTQSTIGTITNGSGMTTWLSTATAARTHAQYLIQGAAASTNSGAFTTSSNCQHAGVVAAFMDTVVVTFYYHPQSFALAGIQ